MADQRDVRRIAMTLPGVLEAQTHGHFGFSVELKGKPRGFVWVWQERIHPKKPRVPQPKVIAARVANETEKAALLAADPEVFFTEPHYNGFPAVLVRLPVVPEPVLYQVIVEAWRCMAPKDLVAAYDIGDEAAPPVAPAPRKPRAPAAKPRAPAAKPRAAAARPRAAAARPRAAAAKPRATSSRRGAKRPPARSSR